MKNLIYLLILTMAMVVNGCSAGNSVFSKKIHKPIALEYVETDLSTMSDSQIEDYANECISNKKIFIYIDADTNEPLVDEKELDFARSLKEIFVVCTGGEDAAYKFNKLMFDYLNRERYCPIHNKKLFRKKTHILYGEPAN